MQHAFYYNSVINPQQWQRTLFCDLQQKKQTIGCSLIYKGLVTAGRRPASSPGNQTRNLWRVSQVRKLPHYGDTMVNYRSEQINQSSHICVI